MKPNDIVFQDENFRAWRDMGLNGLRVHVYANTLRDWVGDLPYEATEADVKNIIDVFKRARQRGFDEGKANAQRDMRNALGLE